MLTLLQQGEEGYWAGGDQAPEVRQPPKGQARAHGESARTPKLERSTNLCPPGERGFAAGMRSAVSNA